MKLLPLDTPELLELAARWLTQKENYQWLDFGSGRQMVTPALLKVMAQRETHCLRIFTSDNGDVPVGIVGLNDVNRAFGTATFWGATGEKSFRNRGYGTLAGSMFLTVAFRDLGLNSVFTWVVDGNPSLKIIDRLRFRFIGRQRQCHYIDGRPYDRLLFDLVADEHAHRDDERWHRSRKSPRENGVDA